MVKCCQEKLSGRATGPIQSFCWLYRLISGKQAKIYHILPPFNLLYSEQKRFSHGKVLIPHITATLTRKIVFRSGGRHGNCATFVHRGPSSGSHAPVGQSNGLSMVQCLTRIFFHLPSQRSSLLFFVNRAIPSQALSWSFTKQQTSVEPTTKGRSS